MESQPHQLPMNLTPDQEGAVKMALQAILDTTPGQDSYSIPVTYVCSVSPRGEQLLETYFTHVHMPQDPSSMTLHYDVTIMRDEMEEVLADGQEALWDWIRDISMDFLGSALVMGADRIPDRLVCCIGSAARSLNLRRHPEIERHIRNVASEVAMAASMARATEYH